MISNTNPVLLKLSGAAIAAVNMTVMMSHQLSLTRALHGCHAEPLSMCKSMH
jgi:hypothetical protein